MTAIEARSFVGQPAVWTVAAGATQLLVEVTILDVKSAYGRLDFQIAPKAGLGRAWVSAGSVEIVKPRSIPVAGSATGI